MSIIIRERVIDDVNEFYEFLKKLEREAKFIFFECGERKVNKKIIAQNIEKAIKNGDICYVVTDNNKIIGYVIAVKGHSSSNNHIATIVSGLLNEYSNQGIGYSLYQNVIKWANECNIKKLELSVITDNKVAIYLYRKFGFEIEGTRKMAALIDGKYYDEYYMAKIL
ncbi:GNAT family N-acetyltransferase [Sedimentibacter sp.]|uniref:GNAT family N-acetyltransferase n=1 Tax=Sedimentibacter sp. TaxID=1960295 RepID=UPI00289E4A1A|nr:GNAT family N-acetyltransferase [Sedimentibacter sp.]